MKYAVVVVMLLLVVVLGTWIAHAFFDVPVPLLGAGRSPPGGESDEETTTGPSRSSRTAKFLGWLEPAGGVIEITGTPGDRLQTLCVKEGDVVQKGAELAVLETYAIKVAELGMIDSQIEEARAKIEAEKTVATVRIRSAEVSVKKARMQRTDIDTLGKQVGLLSENRDKAGRDYDRFDRLRLEQDGLVSDQELEGQGLLMRKAEGELISAEADLEKLNSMLDLNEAAAQAELDAAHAGLKQVEASSIVESLVGQREMVEAQLALSKIVAPTHGRILKIFMEPGESFGRTPLLQMADLSHMVAVAEVYESDVKHIQPKQSAVVRSDAFRRPYDQEGLRGKVERIGKLIRTPELKSLDPFARADRHVVAVRVELDEKSSKQAADFVNLQVQVEFRLDGSAGTRGSLQKPPDPARE